MKAIDKFRFEYNTALTNDQISAALNAAPALPASAGLFSRRLEGKNLRIVLDNGDIIEYGFGTEGQVLLKEKNTEAVWAAAGVMELGDIVLVAVRVPGTLRYILTALDTKARLATVFYTWFGSDDFPKREIQRDFHFGFMDDSGAVPGDRHEVTRRMSGKAILWEDDTGVKLETIYATPICSTYVEVGTPCAGDTFSVPSDYIALSERCFLYSRVEVEFSGALVLDVIDLFDLKSIGVRLGLDENDALDYKMYHATGKYLGQLSAYGPFAPQPPEAFDLKSGSREIRIPKSAQPGFRPAYRPFSSLSPITLEEINRICDTSNLWARGFRGEHNESSEMMLPCTDLLVGKACRLRFDDGRTIDYDFTGKNELRFRLDGAGDWTATRCEAFEADTKLVMVAHVIPVSPIHGMTVTLDLADGLVTWFDTYHANREHPREPNREIHFGVIEMDGLIPPKYRRHGYTNELVGHSYTWNYTYSMTSQHIYSSPWSYSWSIMLPNGTPGTTWSSPCTYIKIREGVYMLSWIEERSQGGCSTYLFNTKTMHDCGSCYGVSFEDVFSFNTFGAEARDAGKLDLTDIYGICGY